MENKRFQEAVERNEKYIKESQMFLPYNCEFTLKKNEEIISDNKKLDSEQKQLGFELKGYGMVDKVLNIYFLNAF